MSRTSQTLDRSPSPQTRFRRSLRRSLLAPVLLTTVLAAVFLYQIDLLLDQERWVDHTDQVIARANETEKLLLRMQSSVRAFLLTGREEFLERFRQSEGAGRTAAAALAGLVSDNPPQVERAWRIAKAIDRSRDVNAAFLAARQGGGDFRAMMGGEGYRELVDERDRAFAEFIGVEERLRATRAASAQLRARSVVLVSLGLAGVVGLGMAWVVYRELGGLSGTYQGAIEAARRVNEELEERVRRRTAELEEAVGQLEAFNYSVSHDLRAPLRAMQGFSQALVEDHADQLDATAREYARRIAGAARRMDEMIEDLLAYSRLNRAEVSLGPVDVRAAVGRAVAQLDGAPLRAPPEVSIPAGLPAARAHAQTLVQVVANLLSNAAKFVAPGQPPRVRVRAERAADGGVRLWVEDNGIGIAPEHRERIFNVFERLHGSETYPGTGIGLAIVRRGIERMGGRLGVESEPGLGSRFWIELPAAPAGPTAAAAAAAAAATSTEEG